MWRRLFGRLGKKREDARFTRAWPGSGLHICPRCGGPFVCPVRRRPTNVEGSYRVLLRCGQCEAHRELLVSASVAERLEADLELARDQLQAALARIEREPIAVDDVEAGR
jgi:uncharacterized protein YceH (UPF0502 family)